MFLDRERELGYLEQRYRREGAQFVVLYGRRRTGKTALLYQFCADKDAAFSFYMARPGEAPARQLQRFSQLIQDAFQMENAGDVSFSYPSWAAAFTALVNPARERRIVVVLDEYPYLVAANREISGHLLSAWDLHLQHTQIFLVLCGSTRSIIHRELLAGDAPLYSRPTWTFHLRPLRIYDLQPFVPEYSPQQRVEMYSIVGGMPFYVRQFSSRRSIFANIRREILDVGGALFSEPRLLLSEEMRDPLPYYALLQAIAGGAHRPADIGRVTHIENGVQIQRMLKLLVSLDLVEQRVPVGPIPGRRRWSLYHLRDPFLRFWFRFVEPARGFLELGAELQTVMERIRREWPQFVAPVWERIAREHLYLAGARRELPFTLDEVGSWWSRDTQIDVVGVNRAQRRAVIGEARWRREPFSESDLKALMARAGRWSGGDPSWEIIYAVCARNLSDAVREIATDEEVVFAFTPDDVLSAPLP